MRLALISLVLAAGCDLDFDFQSRTIDVHSELGQVTITTCEDGGLLGCDDAKPYPPARAQLDGHHIDLVPRTDGFLELFPAFSRIVTAQSPDDPHMVIELDYAGWDAEELPWFDITAPDTQSRARPVTAMFQEYPDAEVAVGLSTQCGTYQNFQQLAAPTEHGKVTITVSGMGTCTHDLRITQTLRSFPENRNIAISVARTEHMPLTTTP